MDDHRKQSYNDMIELDKNLLNSQFNYDTFVVVLDDEGSLLFYRNAFLVDANDFIWIYSEHREPVLFHKEEVEYYYMLKITSPRKKEEFNK